MKKVTTLVYLIKDSKKGVRKICLGMKKIGFGSGKFNGIGGKIEKNESIEVGAIREVKEEIGVEVIDFEKKGEIKFTYTNESKMSQVTHVFICTKWAGEIIETDEIKPYWFDINEIPIQEMWIDDEYWLMQVLKGMNVEANFQFEGYDKIKTAKLYFY